RAGDDKGEITEAPSLRGEARTTVALGHGVQPAAVVQEFDDVGRAGVEDVQLRLREDAAEVGGNHDGVVLGPQQVQFRTQVGGIVLLEIGAGSEAAGNDAVSPDRVPAGNGDVRLDEEELVDASGRERVEGR